MKIHYQNSGQIIKMNLETIQYSKENMCLQFPEKVIF